MQIAGIQLRPLGLDRLQMPNASCGRPNMQEKIYARRSDTIVMRILLSILMIIFLGAFMACADEDLDKLQKSIDIYNSKMDKAPSLVRGQLGDEKINATILLNNGSTIAWGFETKDQKIVRSEKGGIENPTIDVYATEDLINRLENSADPLAIYRDAEKSGEVSIKCSTPSAKLKLAIILYSDQAIKFFFGIISDVRAPIS
jgi:hypothetical protein